MAGLAVRQEGHADDRGTGRHHKEGEGGGDHGERRRDALHEDHDPVAPVQTCVSDKTVLVAGSNSGNVRLDTLQIKTSGSGVCGNSRANTASWSAVKCAKAGSWLPIGKSGANAVGLEL